MSKVFQEPTKLREPVGWVQFVVFDKIYSKLHEKNPVSTY